MRRERCASTAHARAGDIITSAPSSLMRAARACAESGRVVIARDVRVPAIGARDALVRVRAAGVNHIDANALRDGYAVDVYAGPPGRRETWTPGREFSGVVAAVGRDVRDVRVGDEVYGATAPTSRAGAFAEYASAPAHALARKPVGMTHEEACAIPFAALTAHRAMMVSGRARAGERALVLGGGSAVGTAACALAKAAGCEVVTTCGKRDFEFLRGVIGVDDVVDYEAKGEASLRGRAAREGWAPFDVAVDCVGLRRTEVQAFERLRHGVGRYVTLHGDLGKSVTRDGGMLFGAFRAFGEYARRSTFARWQHDISYVQAVMRLDPDAMIDIARLVESGKLRIPVGEVLPLDDIERAYDLLRDRSVFGKIVVTL